MMYGKIEKFKNEKIGGNTSLNRVYLMNELEKAPLPPHESYVSVFFMHLKHLYHRTNHLFLSFVRIYLFCTYFCCLVSRRVVTSDKSAKILTQRDSKQGPPASVQGTSTIALLISFCLLHAFNSFVLFFPPANERSADGAYMSASSPARGYVIPAGGDKYKKTCRG
jgi:hypothetical protein